MPQTDPYDRCRLQELGRRRQAALNELEAIRQAVIDEIPAARAAGVTWREISQATTYTENQLQNLARQ